MMFKILKANLNSFLIICFVCVLLSPFILTRNGIVDFSNTGEIGDTIGGITAPVLNFFAIILLYLTLQEQIRISTEQTRQFAYTNKRDALFRVYETLERHIANFKYTYTVNSECKTGQGIKAIEIMIENLNGMGDSIQDYHLKHHSELVDFKTIIFVANNLGDLIHGSSLEDNDRRFLIKMLKFQVNDRLFPLFNGVHEFNEKNEHKKCSECGYHHKGFPSVVFHDVINLKKKVDNIN